MTRHLKCDKVKLEQMMAVKLSHRPRTNLELHGADLVEDLSHVLPDHGPGDLVVALSRGLHRVSRHVVECDHVGQNSHRFVERTEPEETISGLNPLKGFRYKILNIKI